jgi:hypothetical protein
MTDLNPISILLGKSTSRLCGALMLLAAQIPFTIFAVTLGGVALVQIIATYCTLAAYTFLLCNIALLGSVIARHTTGAITFSTIVMGVFLGGSSALESIAGGGPYYKTPFWQAALAVSDWWWKATPMARLGEVFGTKFAGPVLGWQVISNVAAGIVFFILSWVFFERFCDRAAAGTANTGAMARLTGSARKRRPGRPVKDALVWKDFHFLCGGRVGLIARVILYAGIQITIIVGVHYFRWDKDVDTLWMYFAVPIVFSIDFAATAARVFRDELQGKTLSTLATIPLTMREIVGRKVRVCLLAATPGLIGLIAWTIYSLRYYNSITLHGLITMSVWFMILLLVHVAARLSLSMKYAALPVSFVVTLAGYGLISAMYGPWGACVAAVVIALHLFYEIPNRLEALAGEG